MRFFKFRQRQKKEQIFQECLSALQGEGMALEDVLKCYPEFAEEIRPALSLAEKLDQQAQNLPPRLGFVESSRRRLQTRIGLDQPQNPSMRWSGQSASRAGWRGTLVAANLSALLVLALTVFYLLRQTVSWAQIALPGDGVYLVKLLVEDAQMAFTFDPAAKANLRIELAQVRSNEIQELILEERYDQIPVSAVDFLSQVYQAEQEITKIQNGDPATAARLKGKLSAIITDQYAILYFLMDVVPAHARSAIEQALIVAP